MLRMRKPVETPYGITLSETVWRWTELYVDVGRMSARFTLSAFPSVEIASIHGAFKGRPPILDRRYEVSGPEFVRVILGQPQGSTLSDAVSNAIYKHVQQHDPLFSDVESVEPVELFEVQAKV